MLFRYLIAQRIMKPMIFILLLTSCIHVLLVYLFIYPLDMGFLGAPSATAVAQCSMLVIGVLVIRWRDYHKQTWPPLSMDIFRGWFPILRFGLPGMMMLCLEWWSFELCALAAGWMGAIQLDSFVVLLQVQSFIFMIPLGLSIAISTVTGNRLGAGQPGLAKQGAGVAIAIGLMTQSVTAIILVLARKMIGRLFSDDDAVVDLVSDVFPITGVMLLFDAMQVVCGGVLRGIGYQSIGAATNLAGFYLFVSHQQSASHCCMLAIANSDLLTRAMVAICVVLCPGPATRRSVGMAGLAGEGSDTGTAGRHLHHCVRVQYNHCTRRLGERKPRSSGASDQGQAGRRQCTRRRAAAAGADHSGEVDARRQCRQSGQRVVSRPRRAEGAEEQRGRVDTHGRVSCARLPLIGDCGGEQRVTSTAGAYLG